MQTLIVHVCLLIVPIWLVFKIGELHGAELMRIHIIRKLAELAMPNSEELHNIIVSCKYFNNKD